MEELYIILLRPPVLLGGQLHIIAIHPGQYPVIFCPYTEPAPFELCRGVVLQLFLIEMLVRIIRAAYLGKAVAAAAVAQAYDLMDIAYNSLWLELRQPWIERPAGRCPDFPPQRKIVGLRGVEPSQL